MAYTARKGADLKEFFDEPKELQLKIKKLASLIRKSKHFVCYTGAGISTSCGIADYRSGINTVLKTGAGKWAKEAAAKDGLLTDEIKAKHRKLQENKTRMSKAVPSPSHMALIALAEAGYLKHLVSQNTDGLHRRSGFPINQLSELHGNGTLEECSVCGKVYMRDYKVTNYRPQGHFSKLKCIMDGISADLESNVYCLPDSEIIVMTELLASASEFHRTQKVAYNTKTNLGKNKLSAAVNDFYQKGKAEQDANGKSDEAELTAAVNEFYRKHKAVLDAEATAAKDKILEEVVTKRTILEHLWKQVLGKINRKMPRYLHATGRRCTIKGCGGKLTDTIINFGESLPVQTLECAQDESERADLFLVLGSSCTVYPAAGMPESVGTKWQNEVQENAKKLKNKRKEIVHNLCIVNIQKTPLHPLCSLPIHSKIDEVMIGVMKELGLEIPTWSLTRYLKFDVLNAKNCDKKKLCISGCDADETPYSVFKEVILKQNGKRLVRLVDDKNYVEHEWDFIIDNWDKLSVELKFCGNYEEPNFISDLSRYFCDDEIIETNGHVMLEVEMNLKSKEWIVKGATEAVNAYLSDNDNDNDDQKENE